jgi:hypothetical protein
MASFFKDIPVIPPSGVLGLALQCSEDNAPEKIDLVIGMSSITIVEMLFHLFIIDFFHL